MLDSLHMQPLLVERAIEPKSKADQEKLELVLAQLAAEDASFRVSVDRESGQIILKGTSEDHLEDKADVLRRSGIALNVGASQVALLEHPMGRAEVQYTHKKILGPMGQFAAVTLAVEPNERGKGYEFESKIVGGAVPKEYIPGVEKGLQSVLSSGVVAATR